ncbi:ANTAR domain-containing protein [Thalassiella azotivora]
MTRVLMGDFTALQRLGLEEVLQGEGVEVVEAHTPVLVQRLLDVLPDVVVLDGDALETDALVATITHRFPRITVIACSSTAPVMRVFPSLHHGESYTTRLEPALLTSAIHA